MKTLKLGLAITLAALSSAANAATWTGSADTSWGNSANWDTGSVPGDVAIFTGAPTANQPDMLGSGRSIGTLTFESAGWTISGTDGGSLFFSSTDGIDSSGAGVNTVDVAWGDNYQSGLDINAGIGNTLVLKKNMTQRRNYATSGGGMIVFEGNGAANTWNFGAATTLFNGTEKVYVKRDSVVQAGCTLGGTAPELQVAKYSSLSLEDGASLSPGGDGVFGNLISTMKVTSDSTTVRAYLDMGGSSSSLIMDLGSSVGENDQVIVDLSASNGYFQLRDCELALRGPATLADGDYTLISEITGNYGGSFGSITYNGAAASSENFSLTYNEDSVVLSVTGVPEPATVSLMAMGALALIRRKK